MLKAHTLQCIKADAVLFDRVDFALAPGCALQITGANGSGKTSLLRILAGLSLPESGEVHWRGRCVADARAYQDALRYVAHEHGFSAALSARENLQFGAHLYFDQSLSADNWQTQLDAALRAAGLRAHANTRCRELSEGQRRRLALARLLLGDSQLWLLDEPAAGLDTSGINWLGEIMTRHLQNAGLIIFTSHQPLALPRDSVTELALS